MPGHAHAASVTEAVAALADHPKWEIRRAVALTAAHCLSRAFEAPLVRLVVDDNARVRQAAEQAVLRRRDGRQASLLGKQHEDRINALLEDIETRFGVRGRAGVKRAADEIANLFARELYHEVVKLLTPLAVSAERLKVTVAADTRIAGEAHAEISRIDRQVRQLRAVLDAMRSYTTVPRLNFASETLREVVDEAWGLARVARTGFAVPAIKIEMPAEASAQVARSRLVQALTNLLMNAIEAYDGRDSREPIYVSADARQGHVVLVIKDNGCGMSPEAVVDARTLFATNKPNGTGFGLPLAIKIIESEHRGRLTLRSELDQGCEVEVILPREQALGET